MPAHLVLSIVAAGVMAFSGIVVETAMNVTFPTLMAEFGVSTSEVQWITTGYLLVLAIVIPASSYLNRRFSKRALFVADIALFLAGTALGATAAAFPALLAGRLVQGVGTGIAWPLMTNIVVEQAPRSKRGMMMGVIVLITVLAPAVGPSFGGFLSTHFGWRWIFASLIPLLLAAFVVGVLSIRSTIPPVRGRFQVADFALLSCAFACLILATSYGADLGWASPPILGLFAGAAAFGVAFCAKSLRSARPLIDVRIFAARPYAAGVCGILGIQMITLGIGFLLPNFAQIVNGENAFVAGCLLLPGCAAGACLSPFSGRLLDRFEARRPIMAGGACVLASCVLFAVGYGAFGAVASAIVYIVFTVGQGLSLGNLQTNAISALPAEKSSDGTAMMTTIQQLGSALGTSIVASIVQGFQQTAAPDGFAVATYAGTGCGYLALVAVAVLTLAAYAVSASERREASGDAARGDCAA